MTVCFFFILGVLKIYIMWSKKMSDIVDKIKDIYGKKTIAETFSGMSVANPVMASLEVLVLGMDDLVSLKSRIIKTAVAYILMPAVMEGRGGVRRLVGVTDDSSEKKKSFVDGVYGSSIGLLLSVATYVGSGETDFKKIAGAVCLGFLMTPPVMYMIDTYKDVMGIKESKRRIPKCLRSRSKSVRRTLTAGLLAVGMSFPAVYCMTEDTSVSDRVEHYSSEVVEYVRSYDAE